MIKTLKLATKPVAIAIMMATATGAANANNILKSLRVNNSDMPAAIKIADDKAKEEWAYSTGIQAVMFTIPLVMHDVQRDIRSNLKLIERIKHTCPCAPLGQWGHNAKLATSDDVMPYTPNRDTVYSGLGVDLAKEPIILVVPAIKDRYYSIQIGDGYIVNTHYIGTRATGTDGGNYALVGPDWQGTLPKGVKELRMPHNAAIAALRIASYSETPEDLKIIEGYQQQFDAVPLSQWGLDKSQRTFELPELVPTKMGKGPLAYFSYASQLLRESPPKASDMAALNTFKHIGLTLDKPFEPSALDPAIARGLARSVQAAIDIIKWKVKFRGTQSENKWNVDFVGGAYGTDYLARAEGAVQGLFVHSPEEAIYFHTYSDVNNEPLLGTKEYTLHFTKEQLATTAETGFWSITMYGDDYQLVSNPINRFNIRKSTKGLSYNDDGSLTLYIQRKPPEGHESNWLPTPEQGIFRLNYRVYLPDEPMRHWDTVENYLPGVTPIK